MSGFFAAPSAHRRPNFSAVEYPGGGVDDPGGGNTDDLGSFSNFAISTTTSPKTSASFVSSSLTTRISLLSLSDKSAVDVVGNVDVDYATGSFYSSCTTPPRKAGGLWCSVRVICATARFLLCSLCIILSRKVDCDVGWRLALLI